MSLSVRSSIVAQAARMRRISRSRAILNHNFATIEVIKLIHRPQPLKLLVAKSKRTPVGPPSALADH
jgi:hypothetical protein